MVVSELLSLSLSDRELEFHNVEMWLMPSFDWAAEIFLTEQNQTISKIG